MLAAALDFDAAAIVLDERIYANSLGDLMAVVGEHCAAGGCVLLVGHNPGLDALLEYLSTTPPPRNSEGKLLTTAALAVLEYGAGPVHAGRGGGKLLHLVRPADLKNGKA